LNKQIFSTITAIMPLPSDEVLVQTAESVKELMKGAFHTPPGFRPGPHPHHSPKTLVANKPQAHAKGVLLSGTFTPTPEAAKLSKAPHFQHPVPVLVRFSNSTGIPVIPDNDGNAVPNGIGIRFQLPEENGRRKHTDIVGHSTPHFPAKTGAEFGELFKAIGGGPSTIGPFLAEHPAAARFVGAPKPFVESYASQEYFALHSFGLESGDGKVTWLKYTVSPVGGVKTLAEDKVKDAGPNYLHDEIIKRAGDGGEIAFNIVGTVAKDGDNKSDITEEWAGPNETVTLGSFKLTEHVKDDAAVQKTTIFDPVPRVAGIKEPENDKILEFRAALYLLSGRERRAA
jgi:catalase